MVDIKPSVSIIILNVNLNIPTKIQRPKDSMKKQDPTICYLQEIHFKHIKAHADLKIRKGWRKIFHMNTNQKKVGVAMLY